MYTLVRLTTAISGNGYGNSYPTLGGVLKRKITEASFRKTDLHAPSTLLLGPFRRLVGAERQDLDRTEI